MHKTLTALALTAVFALPVVASADETADKFFAKKATPLTTQDRAALDIAKRWEVGSDANIKPTASADGSSRARGARTGSTSRVIGASPRALSGSGPISGALGGSLRDRTPR